MSPRRGDGKLGAYFVDRFDALTLSMVVALLALTIIDGVLTIELIGLNSEEINPVMVHLLERGHTTFLVGKYILTAAGLPFIVLYKHYPMFGSRFRVGYLLPVFIGLYLVLLCYQCTLLGAGGHRHGGETAEGWRPRDTVQAIPRVPRLMKGPISLPRAEFLGSSPSPDRAAWGEML